MSSPTRMAIALSIDARRLRHGSAWQGLRQRLLGEISPLRGLGSACFVLGLASAGCGGGERSAAGGSSGTAHHDNAGSLASAGTMAMSGAGGTRTSTGGGSGGSGGRTGGSGSSGGGGGSGANGGGAGASAQTRDCKPPAFPDQAVTCRRDEECGGGAFCVAEKPPPLQCGAPCPGCLPSCQSDADCPGGVCDSSPQLPADFMQCMPSCTSIGCESGARCETDGRCRPVPCAEGFTCPEHMRCTSSAFADANGCEQIACDEPDGIECVAPAVCTSEPPRMPFTGLGCALVPCQDPRHPGCEINTRCKPELESPTFGCTRLSCRSDADCDCGACLFRSGSSEGLCYDHIGMCMAMQTCPP